MQQVSVDQASKTAVIIAGMFAVAVCSAPSIARAESAVTTATACKTLETTDFSSIQDAPTQVMEASIVGAAGEVPAHCHVQGYIAPHLGFELKLPAADWNGKFIELGCGSFCGSTRFKSYISWCQDALRRGYACIVSDQGHTSTKDGGGARAGFEALWAYNNLQAEIDYGFRAAHVVALAGKAITQHYYGRPPKLSYFMGGSGGGRQALVAAQRFPWDFDGIFAMDPALNLSGVFMSLHWQALAVTNKDGQSLFAPDDLDLLHNAVLAECDAMDDRIKDSVIGDPRNCKFDPAELLCKSGNQSGCLSQQQVVAAQKLYSGPVTAKGERILVGGATPGSEKGHYSFSAPLEYSTEFFRYMGFMPDPGPSWQGRDFDFDADYKRLGLMEMIYASNNPDLRSFKKRGGKLIIAHGWDDSGFPMPLNTVDYYEMVERTMGGREVTQEFARLFMMPGRGHGRGGAGANAIDFLSYLEAWVEQGQAPAAMIAAHIEGDTLADFVGAPKDSRKVKFTRPLYPYPIQARYKGTGDPNDYRNFEPFDPTSR